MKMIMMITMNKKKRRKTNGTRSVDTRTEITSRRKQSSVFFSKCIHFEKKTTRTITGFYESQVFLLE